MNVAGSSAERSGATVKFKWKDGEPAGSRHVMAIVDVALGARFKHGLVKGVLGLSDDGGSYRVELVTLWQGGVGPANAWHFVDAADLRQETTKALRSAGLRMID